ncbi:MAG: hypothetical protein IV100_31580 [Myxococcales bacterium]|nr:hypothetical protein [Myxococcales bacterium]
MAARLWVLLGASLTSCEPADDAISPDAQGDDGGESVVIAPAPEGERPLIAASEPTAPDQLFPALEGDDLVWVEGRPIPARIGDADPATFDCLACPTCGYCDWEVKHRDLASGESSVLWTQTTLRGPPRLKDGIVVWLRTDGGFDALDLGSGQTWGASGDAIGYLNITPIPAAGALWWTGYHPQDGRSGIQRYVLATGKTELVSEAWLYSNWDPSGSGLAQVAKSAIFDVDSNGDAVYPENGGAVARTGAVGQPPTRLELDSVRTFIRVVSAGPDELVTLDYDAELGCAETTCVLSLHLWRAGESVQLTDLAARPTRYVAPVVSGRRVYWLDHRDGPYALYSTSLDNPEGGLRRETSEDAVLSGWVPPACSGGRCVWMDKRDGNWRIYGR